MAKEFVSINSINIKNFKSIIDTTIQLGGFNVFIGANGCGKSNILEAIALGAAASADKLDFEYFGNRGIRITEPDLMYPRFQNSKIDTIDLLINNSYDMHIYYDDKKLKSKSDFLSKSIQPLLLALPGLLPTYSPLSKILKSIPLVIGLGLILKKLYNDTDNKETNEFLNKIQKILKEIPISAIQSFLIYSLDESKLRQADASNRIYPLGIHGEGLFAYLKEISKRENSKTFFNELKENLAVFDWLDDIKVPKGQLSNEYNIILKDYYLDETLNTFDQRNTNEGFLYLLFYLTLIISDETPNFFAIENIDASFNPKLCREVIKRLIVLARKHNKQIIATTHNPAVLDGLDLEDDDVRLYTVFRTVDGDTKADRVELKSKLTIPLSEAWQRGYIGGLPNNF